MMQSTHDTTSPSAATSELIGIDVLARRLGCSTRHVRRLVDSGRIPQPVKLGALLRWVRADIDQWIAAGCPSCRKSR